MKRLKQALWSVGFSIFPFVVWNFLMLQTAQAQRSLGGLPLGWSADLQKAEIPTVSISLPLPAKSLNTNTVNGLDLLQFQVAVPVETRLSLQKAGKWTELPNGARIWQLEVMSPGAQHLSFGFRDFYLPQGSLLYLYAADHSQVLGAFSFHNNRSHRRFSTAPVNTEKVIIEYFEPAQVRGMGSFTISRASHGLVKMDQTQEKSTNCQVGINCSPEGDNWQLAKRSITRILVNGTYVCTGALLNNTLQDQTPYVLTSRHCLFAVGYDAVENPNATDLIFYWNEETTGCSGAMSAVQTTSGATLVACSSQEGVAESDFALLLLDENPADLLEVYFAGFDATGNLPTSGVCMHHPSGQPKRIATFANSIVSYFSNRYWKVNFQATPNGFSVPEGGSSGSSLFDENQRIVGQLYGGSNINCSDPASDWSAFGKLAYSWNNNGATDPRRRLRDWLDPSQTGALCDGFATQRVSKICQKPFISEYIEGTGFQRCIEIYNPSEETIDLAAGAYSLQYYFEGNSTAGSLIPLTGSIAAHSTYVVCDNDAGPTLTSLANQTAYPIFFSGDDAVLLFKGVELMDAIGQVGVDPGLEWGAGYVSTANNTIARKKEILQGDTDPLNVFVPGTEWQGFPNGTIEGLGFHDCNCSRQTCVPGLFQSYECSDSDQVLDLSALDQFTGPGATAEGFSPTEAGLGVHQYAYIHNGDTCRFSITIADSAPPQIACHPYILASAPEAPYQLQPENLLFLDQSSDNCSDWWVSGIVPPIIYPSQSSQIIPVTVNAVDEAGNATNCATFVKISGVNSSPAFGAISLKADSEALNIWPNPANTEVEIETTQPAEMLKVLDLRGVVWFQSSQADASPGHWQINIKEWPAGLYIVTWEGSNQKGTAKLVKQAN